MAEQVFIARERELSQLRSFLNESLTGHGQVCFVTGEAGAGKTALATEFARRAQALHDDLLVAIGDCNAQTGIGDPYLPFREVLGMLTGDVERELAQGTITQENAGRLQNFLRISGKALVELGPDLIEIFVPAAGLATRAGAFVAGRAGWLDKLEALTEQREAARERADLEQTRIFEQYTNVLKAIAVQRPLMLVIDDLQWADQASIGLLFHLGRRIEDSRLLIIGTYRPADVALGRPSAEEEDKRHPLESVLNEFKRYYGSIRVDLALTQEVEGREFVDALVDTRPNLLGDEFRAALHRHTGGHPLFTKELLRDMRERGELVRNEAGRWVEGPALNWKRLPARVEGVVEERMGRLSEELQDILAVASVEGEQFTVQVIAQVQGIEERHLVRRLGRELVQKHRLIGEQGSVRVGRQRLFRFHFHHSLFQQYLYDRLGTYERELLHEQIAEVLEDLYGDQTDEVAVQLVRHFDQAHNFEKVIKYALEAGDHARRLGASHEAVEFYRRALQRATEEEATREAGLLSRIHESLGDVYLVNLSSQEEALQHYKTFLALAESDVDRARGDRKLAVVHLLLGDLSQAEKHYETALNRLDTAPLITETSRIHAGLAYLLISKNQLDEAVEHANASLEISDKISDMRGLADANRVMGIIAAYRGNLEAACTHFERSLALYRELGDLPRTAQTYNNLGNLCRLLSQFEQGLEYLSDGYELARRIGDRRDEAHLLTTMAELLLDQGEYEAAIAKLKQALPLAEEAGVAPGIVEAHQILGCAYEAIGEFESARYHLEMAEQLSHDTQQLRFIPQIQLDLARLNITQAQFDAADGYLKLALHAVGPEPTDEFLGRWHGCYGYLYSSRNEWDDAVAHLTKSVTWLEKANLRVEAGKACLYLGTAYMCRSAEGDRQRACEHLLAAKSIFEQHDVPGFLSQVEAGLSQLGC